MGRVSGRVGRTRGKVRGGWALWMIAALLVALVWLSVAGRRGADDRGGGGQDRPAAVYRIDVNAAGEAELQLLPGVGPTLARGIIILRENTGPFTSLDDLRRVKGVGRQLPLRWEPYITFGESSAAAIDNR